MVVGNLEQGNEVEAVSLPQGEGALEMIAIRPTAFGPIAAVKTRCLRRSGDATG